MAMRSHDKLPVAPVDPVRPSGPLLPVAPVLPLGPSNPLAPVAPVVPMTLVIIRNIIDSGTSHECIWR